VRPFRDRTLRDIDEAARAAGFEPFGNRDAGVLAYRSPIGVLVVTCERGGYCHAKCEPRSGGLGFPLDDDLFRQYSDGELPHPNGVRRKWTDHEAFVLFLKQRLHDFVRVATSADPDIRAALISLAQRRAALAQARWDSFPRAPYVHVPRKPTWIPPRAVIYAMPVVAIVLGIAILTGLLLLADRYPQRGFEAALGGAWVAVPILATIAVLVARDWRDEMVRRR